MKKLSFAALAFAASIFAAPAMAQDSAVVGTWDTEAVTDFGTFASTMIVAEGDDGYTIEMIDVAPEAGAAAPPESESAISDVVVDGDNFSFKRSMTTPQGAMDLSYTGAVEGDALTASIASDFGAIAVTGTRAE